MFVASVQAVSTEASYFSNCQSCQGQLDVTELAPFDEVECPLCAQSTRVQYEFGRYKLQKLQGVGGMSMIYAAYDEILDRTVVVKILNAEYCQSEKRMVEFEREAEMTAGLNHQNVVKVFTVGQAFGRFFMVMELLPGGSMETQIAIRKKLGEAEVLKLAQEVISGLMAAQEVGMIHRDLKPGNILYDEKGQAKIVDFGLALTTEDGGAQAEEIWATPYYTAPEALTGGEEDFRSDMYALAASLYHALAGTPSTQEESRHPGTLLAAKREIKPLVITAPWVTPHIAETIDRGMAFNQEDRFKSYEDFSAALNGEVIARPKKSWWKRS